MDRNEKIVAAATAAVALGSTALFAIKRMKSRKIEVTTEQVLPEVTRSALITAII